MVRTVARLIRAMGGDGTMGIPRHSTAHEAVRLGVDPVVWVRLIKYWAETNESNEMDPLEGYYQGTLRRYDLKTLKERGISHVTSSMRSANGSPPARRMLRSSTQPSS